MCLIIYIGKFKTFVVDCRRRPSTPSWTTPSPSSPSKDETVSSFVVLTPSWTDGTTGCAGCGYRGWVECLESWACIRRLLLLTRHFRYRNSLQSVRITFLLALFLCVCLVWFLRSVRGYLQNSQTPHHRN
ncbi:hypothetical protein L873DRAFT_1205661 [Choiromyces venosus 120613-1]|uniref:Transmembrane protein n=1 Tax=Choiromyces venosus 120613-1 TaxID=1336337 RepID=A0A3N4JI27_9PEZI|nr:hypothetical protein L873DRAFT_1205661 [Choiromyces venosus 120613-1]